MDLSTESEGLRDSRLCLSYLGSFDDEITDKLIGISEYYLKSESEHSKLRNKVSFLIAECFQNIVRHSEIKEDIRVAGEKASDFFQINVLDDRTILTASNLVDDKIRPDLETKIRQVNSLGSDGLKKLYSAILNNQGFSSKGGAGLGLIEMARKSGFPLKYSFREIGFGYSRFFLLLEVSGHKNATEKGVNISEVERFYDRLSDEEVIMLFKGDLSNDTIVPLVEMAQNNFSHAQEVSNKKKRSIITLIEALQNVTKHGKTIKGTKEGVFILNRFKNSYEVSVGNLIGRENQCALEDNLSYIKSMDAPKLKEHTKQKLMDSQVSAKECGMGLLKIAKNSSGNFQYKFIEAGDDNIFFTLKICI